MSGNKVWVSEASNVDGVSGETILGMLAAGETNIPFDVSQMFYGKYQDPLPKLLLLWF